MNPDSEGQLIKAGTRSYLDIFVAIEKKVVKKVIKFHENIAPFSYTFWNL
jgi:hypothetical protein